MLAYLENETIFYFANLLLKGIKFSGLDLSRGVGLLRWT